MTAKVPVSYASSSGKARIRHDRHNHPSAHSKAVVSRVDPDSPSDLLPALTYFPTRKRDSPKCCDIATTSEHS